MPLHDAFSTGSAIRMSRMSSVPTTEDLKYILGETKKHAKPVELPFENNKSLFVIKVTLTGQTQTPRWTFQKGDGDSAKVLWTRDSTEVLMIQNKVKTESAYDSGSYDTLPASQDGEKTPIITGGSQPIVTPVTRRNFVGWPQAPVDEPAGKVLVPPKPLPLAGFTAEFIASKENWPKLKEDSQPSSPPDAATESLTQIRSFARKTVEQLIVPALQQVGQSAGHKGSPDSGKMSAAKPALEIDAAAASDPATAGSAKASTPRRKTREIQSVTIPLPPPVRFADTLVEHVFNRLFDRNTGLMSFGTLVFFLLREFDRYQRMNGGLAIIICEVAVKRDGKIVGLPFEALQTVAERIRSVCKPHHIAAHVSESEFAILLDEADDKSLQKMCESLSAAISAEPPLLEFLTAGSTRVAIGAASIPNTCTDPGVLVAAAEMAKEMAKEKSPSYLLFPARSDLPAK